VFQALSIALALVAGSPEVQVGIVNPDLVEGVDERHSSQIVPRVLRELASVEDLTVTPLEVVLDPACASRSCLVPLAADSDTSHILRARLEASEQDYDLRLEVLEVETGTVVASAVGSCEVCTEVEIGEMISRTGARLREPLAALVVQSAIIVVDGSPAGARVAIDGEAVGEAPYQGQVGAGTHQLVVTAPDHESYNESWLAESGETHTASFRLAPIETIVYKPTLRWAGWSTLAVGFAGVGAGAVLLALHDRPVDSSCPDTGPDVNGRCPEMYGTLGAGLASLSVGVVAAAVGGTLLGVDAKRRRTRVAFSPRSINVRLEF
jgi:hypothetical protein